MPKRKSAFKSSHHSKKRRTRLAPKNQFVSQLGGWSSYTTRKSRATIRTFSTRPATSVGVLQGADTKGQILISMGASVPQNIRDVFQRIKIKKIEVFANIALSAGDGKSYQFSMCRALQDDDSINPLNVPGAQVKLIKDGDADGSADYMRAARFYPPITFDGAEAVTTKESYLDTSNADGQWKCFNWQLATVNSTARPPTTINFYATITLLCDGQKA